MQDANGGQLKHIYVAASFPWNNLVDLPATGLEQIVAHEGFDPGPFNLEVMAVVEGSGKSRTINRRGLYVCTLELHMGVVPATALLKSARAEVAPQKTELLSMGRAVDAAGRNHSSTPESAAAAPPPRPCEF